MLKRFLAIKKKYRYIGVSVFLIVVGLVCVLIFYKGETPLTDTIMIPAGQTAFSIGLDINEAEPYAGIEFALTLSDENALAFATFAPGSSGAIASPFVKKDGLYYFGLYTGSNAFPAGDSLAGTLNFTDYISDQTLTVTVVQMKVIRLDADNKSVTTEKDSPSYVFTVQRASGG